MRLGASLCVGLACWWDEDGGDFIAVFTSSAQWRSNWTDSVTPIRLDNDLDVSSVLSLPSIFHLPSSRLPPFALSLYLSPSLFLSAFFHTAPSLPRFGIHYFRNCCAWSQANGCSPAVNVVLRSATLHKQCVSIFKLFSFPTTWCLPPCVCEAYPSAARGSSGCASVGALLFSGCHVRSGLQESDRPQ